MKAEISSPGLRAALWIVQGLLFLTFVGGAAWKLLTPREALAAMIPWAGEVPPAFLRLTALVDLAGGVGVLIPALTRIKPGLTVAAAVGCALLQASAIGFHLWRGEAASTPFNVLLLVLSVFLAWGRWRAPVRARGSERIV